MKKRWLSLIVLFCLSIGLVSGCKKETGPVDALNINGSDVVLKVGEKKYTADELFADMLDSGVGAEAAYERILRMVVENSVPVDANMTASWELMLDAFEEEVETTAASSGISEKEARKQLLTEDGYASIEEMKEEYLYSVRLSKLQDNYWDEVRDTYFDAYLNERLPYYVKHVLVKTSYTAARGPYSSIIASSDATALYKVYEMLANDNKFSYIMNQLSEDNQGDNSSAATGIGYHMDMTTNFVTEFLHGVLVFDALLKGKTSEVVGITEAASLYTTNTADSYDFGVINASDIVAMGKGDNATSSSYKGINTYERATDAESDSVSSIQSVYGSIDALYSRTIIFNQKFNNPGISVIAYDLEEENTPDNVTALIINGVEKKVLTDENGNIVFVVCAKGSSSDLWVHFLTINVSPFDTFENTNGKNDAKLFFSIDQEATIAEMVEDKRESLVAAEKTAAEIETEITAYKAKLDSYKTYVDIKGGEKQTTRNEVIDELEELVKTYAKRGITSGAVAAEDQLLTYDMVDYYMSKGNVTITNTTIKNLVQNYVSAQRELIDFKVLNSITEGWAQYYDRVSLARSDEIVGKKVPLECSYVVNGNTNTLCKYNYEKGFEILISYTVNGGTMPETYTKSYYIDADSDSEFTLPTPTKTDSTFGGWYSTSDFKEGTLVESIDTTKTSINNKTQLYAKWN